MSCQMVLIATVLLVCSADVGLSCFINLRYTVPGGRADFDLRVLTQLEMGIAKTRPLYLPARRTVSVDFTKAFDHLYHSVLVGTLATLSMPNVIVRWMCAFEHKQRQCVKIGDSSQTGCSCQLVCHRSHMFRLMHCNQVV